MKFRVHQYEDLDLTIHEGLGSLLNINMGKRLKLPSQGYGPCLPLKKIYQRSIVL
jgi:hypothetical protein